MALEKKMPKWLKTLGAPEPKPLWKHSCPEGLPPSLKGVRLVKYQTANMLANFVANFVFSVENPENSLIWKIFEFVKLLERGDVEVSFHACMFGSQRNKSISLVATRGVFATMNVKCDVQHD